MTHPFSNSVVEAAAKAVMDSDGCTRDGICEKCKEVAVVAISAAFQQARVEGLAMEGFMNWPEGATPDTMTGINWWQFEISSSHPVIIIRKETP